MRQYLIGITYDEQIDVRDETQADREQFVLENQRRNAKFQENLHAWVCEKGFEDQIEYFGETLMFPILSIKCTTEVADLIATYPGVDFVRPDGFSCR